MAAAVEGALRECFPTAAVETRPGFEGRVHVRIIGPAFNGRTEADKQAMVWDALRSRLPKPTQRHVSLVLAFGMDELP